MMVSKGVGVCGKRDAGAAIGRAGDGDGVCKIDAGTVGVSSREIVEGSVGWVPGWRWVSSWWHGLSKEIELQRRRVNARHLSLVI